MHAYRFAVGAMASKRLLLLLLLLPRLYAVVVSSPSLTSSSSPPPPPPVCAFVRNVDYPHNDIERLANITTAAECCARCHAKRLCRAFMFFPPPPLATSATSCWLKSSAGAVTAPKPGAVSGLARRGPAPPLPPSPPPPAPGGGGSTCSSAGAVQLGSWQIDTVTSAQTLAECCEACGAEPRCAAFQFSPGHCTLQGNAQKMGPGHGSYLAPAKRPPPPQGYNTACRAPGAAKRWPFCNASLPTEHRLNDLVARVLISEAGSQLTARQSSALPRLGIPSYYYGTNVLHGFREAGCVTAAGTVHCPTSWPTPPNMGAAFNRSLSAAMGRSFGTELRAMYNVRAVNSLDTWSPTINLARDPRTKNPHFIYGFVASISFLTFS
jgi:hypothetical protein